MTTIITDGCPKDEEIMVEEITVRYIQNPDSTESQDGDFQELVISSRDGGGGKFLNLNTSNWSISGIEDLKILVEDFNKRAGINR